MVKNIKAIPLDSYEDPLSILMEETDCDGQRAIYILYDERHECVVFVCDEPFTKEDVEQYLKEIEKDC